MEELREETVSWRSTVLGLTDKEDYKKIYARTIRKRCWIKTQWRWVNKCDSDGGNESSKSEGMDNLDAKAQMYTQLHQDFGASKLHFHSTEPTTKLRWC